MCGAGAVAPGDAAARRRVDRISARFDSLSLDISGVSPGVWVKATPGASGASEARVRDAAMSLQADGCADERGRVVAEREATRRDPSQTQTQTQNAGMRMA